MRLYSAMRLYDDQESTVVATEAYFRNVTPRIISGAERGRGWDAVR